MQEAQPSRTALRVAVRRAAHQMLDTPVVLDDPIAPRILGPARIDQLKLALRSHRTRCGRTLRAFLIARSRVAEEAVARAVAAGTAQYVVLGAGLDTFAYRNPHAGLRVFEVDFPATQAWKRRLLAAASIVAPRSLTFAPVDFERQTLADGLAAAGFDATRPAFFSWLGVSMYLTGAAVQSTLGFVGSRPAGSGITFDYVVPRSSLNLLERWGFDALSRRVARAGEPFLTFFDPAGLHAQLTELGFRTIEDLGRDEINARFFSGRSDRLRVSGRVGRIVSAEV